MARKFFDTNILVYAADIADPRKQSTARNLLHTQQASGETVLSTQVLQEFYVIATRKIGLSPLIAKAFVQQAALSEVVQIETDMVLRAIDVSNTHSVSFWDALILVSAREGKCAEVISEDLQNGMIIDGVKVVNPFLPG